MCVLILAFPFRLSNLVSMTILHSRVGNVALIGHKLEGVYIIFLFHFLRIENPTFHSSVFSLITFPRLLRASQLSFNTLQQSLPSFVGVSVCVKRSVQLRYSCWKERCIWFPSVELFPQNIGGKKKIWQLGFPGTGSSGSLCLISAVHTLVLLVSPIVPRVLLGWILMRGHFPLLCRISKPTSHAWRI